MSREIPKFQVADGQPDDGGLVQLRGDGRRQRQHFRQFVKLEILLAASRSRRIPALLLAQLKYTVNNESISVKLRETTFSF